MPIKISVIIIFRNLYLYKFLSLLFSLTYTYTNFWVLHDDISLSHILFNHDPGFHCTLILTIGIRALIESVCGKPNPSIFTFIFVAIRYMAPRLYVSVIYIFCMNECFILALIHGRSLIVIFFFVVWRLIIRLGIPS